MIQTLDDLESRNTVLQQILQMGHQNAELRLANDELQSKLNAYGSVLTLFVDKALLPDLSDSLNLFLRFTKKGSEDFTAEDEVLLRRLSMYVSFLKCDESSFKKERYMYTTVVQPVNGKQSSLDLVRVMLQLLFEHIRFSAWFVKTSELGKEMARYEPPRTWSSLWPNIAERFPFDYEDSSYEKVRSARIDDGECCWQGPCTRHA